MSHVTCEWVMSRVNESCHMWMSHVTHEQVTSYVDESRHIWKNHFAHRAEPRERNPWVMSHMWMSRVPLRNASCHTCEYLSTCHEWMCHVTHEWEISCHEWEFYVTNEKFHVTNEKFHVTNEKFHVTNEKFHVTSGWIMSHVCLRHVAYDWEISHTSCRWNFSVVCDMSQTHMWHDSSTRDMKFLIRDMKFLKNSSHVSDTSHVLPMKYILNDACIYMRTIVLPYSYMYSFIHLCTHVWLNDAFTRCMPMHRQDVWGPWPSHVARVEDLCHVWRSHVTCECVLSRIHASYDSVMRVTCHLNVNDAWHDSWTCHMADSYVPWLIHMCHDSWTCVTRVIRMWHGSLDRAGCMKSAWVILHVWMSHGTYRRVTAHVNEACHASVVLWGGHICIESWHFLFSRNWVMALSLFG